MTPVWLWSSISWRPEAFEQLVSSVNGRYVKVLYPLPVWSPLALKLLRNTKASAKMSRALAARSPSRVRAARLASHV